MVIIFTLRLIMRLYKSENVDIIKIVKLQSRFSNKSSQ